MTTLSTIRLIFVGITLFVGGLYTYQLFQSSESLLWPSLSLAGTLAFATVIVSLGGWLRKGSLKALNGLTLGLFFGYLLAQVLLLVFGAFEEIVFGGLPTHAVALVQVIITLICCYWGMVLTSAAAEDWALSIPFVRLVPSQQKKKDILLDPSTLADPRIIDLASSGLLDALLVLPRFVLADLQNALDESEDEQNRQKAKRALEVVKKLEGNPTLGLRYVEHDFPEVKEISSKMVHLARLMNAQVLTADPSRIHLGSVEGVRFINIHTLSNALKPIVQGGESLLIKVQRFGKEPRQGVGYLEDGTMVVVNGGADFVGETIKVQVLSLKHTSAGRMIFCNVSDEEIPLPPDGAGRSMETSVKSYYTLKGI